VILFHILTGLFRDHTLSGGMKTLFLVFLVFLPFLAALVYLISRGKGIAERAAARQQQAQEQFEGYVRSVATTGDATATPTDQIAQAKELLDAGAIGVDPVWWTLKMRALPSRWESDATPTPVLSTGVQG
jgi:type II secretory pathway component PulL